MIFQKLKMEFFGTFISVYFIGLFLIQLYLENIDFLTFCIANFAIYLILYWTTYSISGAHFNPVISLSLVITGHFKLSNALWYTMFQFAGAFAAFSFLEMGVPAKITSQLIKNSMFGFPLNSNTSDVRKLCFEMFLGFLLVFIYYLCFIHKSSSKLLYAVSIPAFYFCANVFSFKFSGAGLNPPRMIAYCILAGTWWKLYIWLLGPIFGGIIGAFLASLLLNETANERKNRIKQERLKQEQEELRDRMKFE